MKMTSCLLFLMAGFVALEVSSGCSRPAGRNVETGRIVITVVNGDQLVTGLTVRAISTSGESGGLADLNAEGKATLEKLDVGEYRVAFFPATGGNPLPEGMGPATAAPPKPAAIPKKLQDEMNTPVRVNVAKGDNTATINLKDY